MPQFKSLFNQANTVVESDQYVTLSTFLVNDFTTESASLVVIDAANNYNLGIVVFFGASRDHAFINETVILSSDSTLAKITVAYATALASPKACIVNLPCGNFRGNSIYFNALNSLTHLQKSSSRFLSILESQSIFPPIIPLIMFSVVKLLDT